MIALDSNVVLRALTGDDRRQSRIAQRTMRAAVEGGTRMYIADAVLCEVAWVLSRQQRMTRSGVAQSLRELLDTEMITVDDDRVVSAALERYERGQGDFADYLIGERAIAGGATEVVTFDRALRGEPGFTLLGA